MSSSVIRALVIDDHQSFVDALSLLVNQLDDLDLVGTATSPSAGLDLLERVPCDVVAMRLSADGEEGPDRLDLVRAVTRARPHLPIVVIAGDDDCALVLDAVELGVQGWVERSDGLLELIDALHDVVRGDGHLPASPLRDLLRARLEQTRRTGAGSSLPLTGREPEVLACLAAGLSRREIGDRLCLSPNAVRSSIRNILRKLHVHSAPAAVALASQGEGHA